MNPLESENDRHTELLAAKASRLKTLVIDIQNDTKEHNSLLESMRFNFESARGFLGGSVRNLGNVMSSGRDDRRVTCYVAIAIVAAFTFMYYAVSSFRNS